MIRLTTALGCLVLAGSAQALIFSGPSFYALGPQTQAPGTVTNNLVLTDTANGFTISGQYIVDVNAGTTSGALLEYWVRRPIDALSPTGAEVLTTAFSGFIDCPVGGGLGIMVCDTTNTSVNANATVNVAYLGGTITPFNINATTNYTHIMGAGFFLEQRLVVTYNYSSTSVGQYIVDLPASSFSDPVPEPATLAVLGLGLVMARRRRR